MALGNSSSMNNNNIVQDPDIDNDSNGSNPFEDLENYLETFDFYTRSNEVMEGEENKYKICQRAYYIGKAYLQLELTSNESLAKKSLEHTIVAFTTAKDFLLENDPTNNSLELIDTILDITSKLKLVYSINS
jgi:hypothetical protein